ncbi:hypothetical protein CMUS01_12067 [Colletotrichum musicola]|uniref:Uncharacterized protein n=1 Tax=Colletotrichum musicola TaxID=2175873 RepID=A0A8H6JRT2_9PEZI|nr:hypothetical protein CMUS01_12067 [Colletotrichum musicola]
MQRHRLGKSYGLPIDSLEQRFEFERHISPGDKTESLSTRTAHLQRQSAKTWHFIHEYSARIKDHELGIHRSHQIRGPSCSVADLSKVIEDLELPICAHIFASAFTPASGVFPDHNSCVHGLHALWLAGRDPLLNTYSDQGGASCTTCRTDYFIEIANGEGRNGWVVNLDSYHNLGGCRDPNDGWWLSLTHTSFSHFNQRVHQGVSVDGLPYEIQYRHGMRRTIPRRWTSSYTNMLRMCFPLSPEWHRWAVLGIIHHNACGTYCSGGSYLLIPRTEPKEDAFKFLMCTALGVRG